MTQQSTTLALPEDQGQFPALAGWFITILAPLPGNLMPLTPTGNKYSHGTYIHAGKTFR